VVFLYAPTVAVASGAAVSAVGGAGGVSNSGSSGTGGVGGPGRIRISAAALTCTLSGTFTPALAAGCAVTPPPGTDGRVYISRFPD
jgi:hypothetical protein